MSYPSIKEIYETCHARLDDWNDTTNHYEGILMGFSRQWQQGISDGIQSSFIKLSSSLKYNWQLTLNCHCKGYKFDDRCGKSQGGQTGLAGVVPSMGGMEGGE